MRPVVVDVDQGGPGALVIVELQLVQAAAVLASLVDVDNARLAPGASVLPARSEREQGGAWAGPTVVER